MRLSEVYRVLIRAASALETPGDLTQDEIDHVIEDVRECGDKIGPLNTNLVDDEDEEDDELAVQIQL